MIEPVIGRRRSSLGSGRMSLSGSGVGLERLAIIRQTTEFEHSQQELRLSDSGDIDENLGSEQFAKDEGEFHYLSPRGIAGVSRRSLGPWLRRAGWALFCYLALLGLIPAFGGAYPENWVFFVVLVLSAGVGALVQVFVVRPCCNPRTERYVEGVDKADPLTGK